MASREFLPSIMMGAIHGCLPARLPLRARPLLLAPLACPWWRTTALILFFRSVNTHRRAQPRRTVFSECLSCRIMAPILSCRLGSNLRRAMLPRLAFRELRWSQIMGRIRSCRLGRCLRTERHNRSFPRHLLQWKEHFSATQTGFLLYRRLLCCPGLLCGRLSQCSRRPPRYPRCRCCREGPSCEAHR